MKRLASINTDLAVDATTLAMSLGIAEAMYRFHSFTLETIAFLGTWYALRRAGRFLVRR